jgi:Xaa-Pro aminopeptidase
MARMDSTTHTTLYAERRARVAAQLGAGGIAIVPTALERPRNRDTDFIYRHDSYFYYLTGFTEPNAWLVITAEGDTTLFCQPKDLEREIWDGIRLGPDAAPEHLGVSAAFSVAELDQRLPRLLENRHTVWYPAWKAGSTAGCRRCAPGCATVRCAPSRSATCAASSTSCGW